MTKQDIKDTKKVTSESLAIDFLSMKDLELVAPEKDMSHSYAIWIRAPGEGYSIYLPYATREGDLSLNIIFSVKLNEEDTNDLKFEDYADNPPILSKKLIDRKPLLKSKVKHILNGIDKIVNRVNGKGVYLIKQF